MKTLQLGSASIIWTGSIDGDLGHRPERLPHDETCCNDEALARRHAVLSGPWVRVHQVHGNDVVIAEDHAASGAKADALVSDVPDLPLAIATADCSPLALSSPEGVVGAVHAGWQGLRAGVIGKAVAAMRERGATEVTAALGPCIHGECYEFGSELLDDFVGHWGDGVRTVTAQGRPAFDVPAAVAVEVERAGGTLRYVDEQCTACSGEHFSYRATAAPERQVMIVRRHPQTSDGSSRRR